MRFLGSLLLLALLLVGGGRMGEAHALDPGYLNLQNLSGNAWRVFWRKPAVKGAPMKIDLILPDNCTPQDGGAARFDGMAFVSQWVATCPGGLGAGRIRIRGLEATRTEVLIRIEDGDHATLTVRLTPGEPWFDIPEDLSTGQVFVSYLALGYGHILAGYDHLLFVFALLVLIGNPWRLAGAITAFTVAHSITLALVMLGVLTVPSPPVEAAIALSIVLLAVEILRRRNTGDQLTEKYPWVIAFSFGLLHGLGFAGALSEIGLPPGDIPMALLAFNIGVEAGQLSFVGAVLVIFVATRTVWPRLVAGMHHPGAPGNTVMGYAIGAMSVYWLAERVAAF